MLRDTMRLNRAGKSHDMTVMRSLPPIISFGPKQPSRYLLSLIAGSDASIGELCEGWVREHICACANVATTI